FQAEDGIRDGHVTGVQTCALPILYGSPPRRGDCSNGRQYFSTKAAFPHRAIATQPDRRELAPTFGLRVHGPCRNRAGLMNCSPRDRKSVVEGKRGELGGRRNSETK